MAKFDELTTEELESLSIEELNKIIWTHLDTLKTQIGQYPTVMLDDLEISEEKPLEVVSLTFCPDAGFLILFLKGGLAAAINTHTLKAVESLNLLNEIGLDSVLYMNSCRWGSIMFPLTQELVKIDDIINRKYEEELEALAEKRRYENYLELKERYEPELMS